MSKRTSEIPECTRNFMEHIRNVQEMESCMDGKEETMCRTAFENVSAKVHSFVSFSQPKNGKATSMRISELTHKTLPRSRSHSVCNVQQSEHERALGSVPNETGPGSYINNGEILSGDMAESVHKLITEDTNDVCTCTDLCINFAHDLPVDSEEPIAFTGERSLGCQAVDSWNLEEYTMGVTMHSSPRDPPLTVSLYSRKRLSSGGGARKASGRSDEPDIREVPLCEQEQEVQECQSVRNAANCRKTTAKSMKARQTESDPLRAPASYRRGVIPKYLAKRLAAMRQEAEEFKRLVPAQTCPPEHPAETESCGKKPHKMLKERHSDLVQGTQHVDPRNLEDLGVIMYSSTRKLPRSTSRHSKKAPPTGGVAKLSGKSDDPDIQKLPQEVQQCQSVSNEADFGTTNITLLEAGQTPTEAVSDPLRAPPTYQRGVVPKYLKKRLATMREDAKRCKRCFPETACPLEHVTDPYRKDYMMMLKKRHSDLVHELKMLPVKTDVRMLYRRKSELEKKVKESEKVMRRFSELSILLH
jgi:hypothetical protein